MSLAFGQGHAETLLAEDLDFARLGHIALDIDPALHLFFKIIAQGHLGLHFVGLLVIVDRIEETVGHAAVVGEDDKALTVLVEAADREEVELLEILG